MTTKTPEIKKGQHVDLTIDNLAFGGRGIAREAGMVIFVDGALPGDRVRALITRKKPNYAEGKATEILTPSPQRQQAPCSIFGVCGGCTLQNFNYAEQIRYKQQHVEEALRHIGKQQQFQLHPIIASPSPYNYRNKMEFSFGCGPGGKIEIGFHVAGNFRRIIDVQECLIQPGPFNAVLAWFRTRLNEAARTEGAHFTPYDAFRHTGFLRHLVLRYSQATGNFLVAIITASGSWKGYPALASDFIAAFPACRGLMWGTNDGLSDVARIEREQHRIGEGTIEERLGDKRYRISTFSFFQTNTDGARLLYDVITNYAELTGKETVLDAYCGTGSIGIYLADRAARVIGIELINEAVWDARYNAKLNGAENCTFLAGEMRDVLTTLPQTMNIRFDRVIVDPPRGGMDKKSLRLLINLDAPLLVYVSCNPATLARDAQTLSEAGYVIEDVQPVDMFPHTWHVESVLKFRKSSNAPAPQPDIASG